MVAVSYIFEGRVFSGVFTFTMSRPRHYVPCISRNVVCALYHEARHRRKPMTRLVDELLTAALQGTPGWQFAKAQAAPVMQAHNDQSTASAR